MFPLTPVGDYGPAATSSLRCAMTKADREALREMMLAAPVDEFVATEGSDEYRIRVLGRGESVFYQQNERALFVEVLAGSGTIFAASIRCWDNGKKISDRDRAKVIERLSDFMKRGGHPRIRVV